MAAQYAELIAYSITLAYNMRHSASIFHTFLCETPPYGEQSLKQMHESTYNLDVRCGGCTAGYAFSTYGDTAACWLQDIVMIFLIARCRQVSPLHGYLMHLPDSDMSGCVEVGHA